MLKILSHVTDAAVHATDGSIGNVKAAFFDDQSWAIRYLVVDTGTWLPGRSVLISPYSVKLPLADDKKIDVTLTRMKVQGSPDVDTHQPVSRQHERDYMDYYAYPEYWNGGGLWGEGAFPIFSYRPSPKEIAAYKAMHEHDLRVADAHLRSSAKVSGYEIHATDGSIGHVKDFVFDEDSWAIRYLVVDTNNWWPGGKKVLIATHWIEEIDWSTGSVNVALTREQVKNSPEYEESLTINRGYEQLLHNTYNRKGYWDYEEDAVRPFRVDPAVAATANKTVYAAPNVSQR